MNQNLNKIIRNLKIKYDPRELKMTLFMSVTTAIEDSLPRISHTY